MYLTDELKRRTKDLFSEAHPAIGMAPKNAVRLAAKNLLEMDAAERAKTLEQIRQSLSPYYEGRHRQNVPGRITTEIAKLESEIARMNRVDWATKRLEELGGPPTRDTIQESLRRSLERKHGHVQSAVQNPVTVDAEQRAKTGPVKTREKGPEKPPNEPEKAPKKLRSHDQQKELVHEP